jgi:hypothetical protein
MTVERYLCFRGWTRFQQKPGIGVHYRMPYFFAGRAVVVLSHGFTKEREVPKAEIERAVVRKKIVEADFGRYAVAPEL